MGTLGAFRGNEMAHPTSNWLLCASATSILFIKTKEDTTKQDTDGFLSCDNRHLKEAQAVLVPGQF